jgi:16S rRNA processing protein RimM
LNTDDTVQLGHISGLFGVKGWVKVFSYTRPRTQILDYRVWRTGADKAHVLNLENGQAHKEGVIAKFVGIDDRDQAVSLLDAEIHVLTNELPELAETEFYWHQLIGLQMVDCKQQALGTVLRMMETGANDVFIVKADDNKEHLVPYIKDQVVKQVDLASATIVVDWDINY